MKFCKMIICNKLLQIFIPNKIMSLSDFKGLAKKYNVTTSGSRTELAERISNLRGRYLTKSEIEMIKPYLKKQTKNKKILLKIHYPAAKKKASIKARLQRRRREALRKQAQRRNPKKSPTKKSPRKTTK